MRETILELAARSDTAPSVFLAAVLGGAMVAVYLFGILAARRVS